MEVELSERTIKIIKYLIREELQRAANDVDEYVSTEDAARILGFSPRYLRKVKDRYVWHQTGDKGKLRFLRRSLIR